MARISLALFAAYNIGTSIETLAETFTMSEDGVREHIDAARQLLASSDPSHNDWASQP